MAEVLSLLSTLDSVKLCRGNPEEDYLKLVEKKGPLKDTTGIVHNIATPGNKMHEDS